MIRAECATRPLCVDTTFDYGNFYYTPVTFLTDKLFRPTTLDRVLLLGPGIIHTRLTATSYKVLANFVKDCIAGEVVFAISPDADPALYQASIRFYAEK